MAKDKKSKRTKAAPKDPPKQAKQAVAKVKPAPAPAPVPEPEAPATVDVALGDPSRVAELAVLERRIAELSKPDELLALSGQVDALAMQLAREITRAGEDAAQVARLKPVLVRATAAYARTLLRTAEKFGDQGSPRRAVFVLLEALRKSIDPSVIRSVAAGLSFTLEANGQEAPATRVRDLVIERAERRAAGVDRREVRTQFAAGLEALRDQGIEWTALDDTPGEGD